MKRESRSSFTPSTMRNPVFTKDQICQCLDLRVRRMVRNSYQNIRTNGCSQTVHGRRQEGCRGQVRDYHTEETLGGKNLLQSHQGYETISRTVQEKHKQSNGCPEPGAWQDFGVTYRVDYSDGRTTLWYD